MAGNYKKIKTGMTLEGFIIYHADDWSTSTTGRKIGETIRSFGRKLKSNPEQNADFQAWKTFHALK